MASHLEKLLKRTPSSVALPIALMQAAEIFL